MSNHTALVTGAGRGIGRAIAVRLAQSGWRVYGGVRTDVAAKELAEESDLITPVEPGVTVPWSALSIDTPPAADARQVAGEPVGDLGQQTPPMEPAEMFHEVLEHRWFPSEQQGRPVRSAAATTSYIENVLAARPDEALAGEPDAAELQARLEDG